MRADTPLPQVALFLSQPAAELLQHKTIETQELVLQGIRLFLAMLEEYEIVLDPIELTGRVDRMVALWVDYL